MDNQRDYIRFLRSKEIKSQSAGFEPNSTNPLLFDWQSDIVRWALMIGACFWLDWRSGK